MNGRLCQLLGDLQRSLPAPAEMERVARSLRQAQQAERAVSGEELTPLEDAMVRAWAGMLWGELHALHNALDALRQHYCREA